MTFQHRPVDGTTNSIGDEASCHAASRLVCRAQVDLEGEENVTKISDKND